MPGIDLTIRMANLQNAVDRLSVLRERYRNLSADIETLRQRQFQLQAQGEKEAKQLQRVTKLIRDKTTQQKALNVSMSQAENSTKRATAQIQKMGFAAKTATTLVNQLRFALVGTFGIFAAIQVFKNLAKEAIAFEDTLKGVKVVSGATAKEMEVLRRAALDIAVSGIFSPSEIAETQINLAKLGFTATEIASMIKSIGDISIVTGEDLEKSTNLMATTLKSFGLAASDTDKIANQMAKAFNMSALGVSNMFEAMKYVGPVARKLGWEFSEVTSLLGIMSDNMISGSLAGTSLRNIMLQLADSNSKLSKNLGMTGTSFDEFIEKVKVMEGASVTAGLETIELRRAITAFFAVVQNTENIKEFNKALNDSDDILKELAEERLKTTAGQWENLGATIKAVGNQISGSNGSLADLLSTVNSLFAQIYKFQKWQDETGFNFWNAVFGVGQGGFLLMGRAMREIREIESQLKIQESREENYTDFINETVASLNKKIKAERGVQAQTEKGIELLKEQKKLFDLAREGLSGTTDKKIAAMYLRDMQIAGDVAKKIGEIIKKIGSPDDDDNDAGGLESRKRRLNLQELIDIEIAKTKYVKFELERRLEAIRSYYQKERDELIEDPVEYDLAKKLNANKSSNIIIDIKKREIEEIKKLEYELADYLAKQSIQDEEKRERELEYLLHLYNINSINLIKDTKQRNLELEIEQTRHSIAIADINKKYSDKETKKRADFDKWLLSDFKKTNDEIYSLKKAHLENEIETNRQLLVINNAGQKELEEASIEGKRRLLQLEIDFNKNTIELYKSQGIFEGIALLEEKIRELELQMQALGIAVTKDTSKGIENTIRIFSEVSSQANSLADDMVSAIDRVVDRYDRMVSDIQHALDRETELMAEGYANNVSLKQQELSRIQALRADALADQERYLAQQRVIESISQGLNIASAISSIIKDSFKNAGIWGTLVAPAVIGAMFSLWRANKVKAVESGYTYGEGGRVTGYIEGKPHSKGGKWINVEGKEYVINTDGVNRETLPMLDYINKYGRVNWEYIGGIENKGVSIVSLDEGKTIKSIHSLLQKMGTESAQVEYHNGFRIHRSGSRIRKVYVN